MPGIMLFIQLDEQGPQIAGDSIDVMTRIHIGDGGNGAE